LADALGALDQGVDRPFDPVCGTPGYCCTNERGDYRQDARKDEG